MDEDNENLEEDQQEDQEPENQEDGSRFGKAVDQGVDQLKEQGRKKISQELSARGAKTAQSAGTALKNAGTAAKVAGQAVAGAVRSGAIALWSAIVAFFSSPYGWIIFAIGILILLIAIAAFSLMKGDKQGRGSATPVYAYDAESAQRYLEMLGNNSGGLVLPYDVSKHGNTITSTFGVENPDRRNHRGIDIGLPIGVRYYSPTDGEIIYLHDSENDGGEKEDLWHNGKGVKQNHGFGNAIAVKISNGKWKDFIYEIHHLKQGSATALNLKKGSIIKAGQPIGMSGHNGQSTGPHLHFSVALPEPQGHCETYINQVNQPCSAPKSNVGRYFINPKVPLGYK